MDMNEIKEIFFQECEEQLAELESGLLRLNDGDRDPETVNAVFRAVHSIKGGAGAFGLDDLVSFAHVFETTLDCVRSGRLEPSQEVLKVMLKSADVLADLTNCARDGGSVDEARSKQLIRELEALAHGQVLAPSEAAAPKPAAAPKAAAAKPAPAPAAAPAANDEGFVPVAFSFDDFGDEMPVEAVLPAYEVIFKPKNDLYRKGNEAALLLRDLSRLGEMSIHCNMDALPALQDMQPEAAYFTWKIVVKTDKGEDAVRSVFEFAEWDCDLEITQLDEGSEQESGDELPMTPVPFDLSVLYDEPEPPVGLVEEEERIAASEREAEAAAASNVVQMPGAKWRHRSRQQLPRRRLRPPRSRSASISTVSTASSTWSASSSSTRPCSPRA